MTTIAETPVKDKRQEIKTLIAGYQLKDPRLYEALNRLADQLGDLTLAVYPIQKVTTLASVEASLLLPPLAFAFVLNPTFIHFYWVPPTISGVFSYELRQGSNWDTAQFLLRTSSTFADINPFEGLESVFMIKTLNSSGAYSEDAAVLTITIDPPSITAIDAKVIDNNILLRWDASPSTYAIDYYEIKTGSTLIGRTKSTFVTYFEVISGTYIYSVTPVDVAGNIGPSKEVQLIVSQPPDYVLQDDRTSALTGTRTNVLLVDGPALLASYAAHSWTSHFTSHGWTSIQDQIDAGYPIYIQPTNLTGSYEEVFDLGAVLANVIASIRYNLVSVTPADPVSVVVKMATSTDNITYSAFVIGASLFMPSVRYIKFRLEFTGSSDQAVASISNVNLTISVKRENDGGEVSAISTDATGTAVTFNKAFKDVESITATVKSAGGMFTVIVDFLDVPNPTGFTVYVYDSTGTRVSKTVEWKARGVV